MKVERFPIHLLQLLPQLSPIQDGDGNREMVYLVDRSHIRGTKSLWYIFL